MLVITGALPVTLRAEACRGTENREENLAARNLPQMTFNKPTMSLIFSGRIFPARIQSFRPRPYVPISTLAKIGRCHYNAIPYKFSGLPQSVEELADYPS